MNIAIIIVTYNRPRSLERVLSSVGKAVYPDVKEIPLIISIDYQESEDHSKAVDIADNYQWSKGSKQVIKHTRNLGLRKHVLECGNLSKDYDAIIMLEDDVFVSPQYYNYTLQALEKYKDNDHIAGISLYKHRTGHVHRPFMPVFNGFDTYLLQFAQSWGQCWTPKMWGDFYEWYLQNEEWPLSDENIPDPILRWPSSSWLKYFIKYLVVQDKYFVYPYHSLSTNFKDAGTHTAAFDTECQVPLTNYNFRYRFPEYEQAIKYDAFYERKDDSFFTDIRHKDVCVDLYASKKNHKKNRFWLTTRVANYKIVDSYALHLRPHEQNVVMQTPGHDIFLYDQSEVVQNPEKESKYKYLKYDYDITLRKALWLFIYKLKCRLKG